MEEAGRISNKGDSLVDACAAVTDNALARVLVVDLDEEGPSSLVHAELLNATLVAEREELNISGDVEVTVGDTDVTDVIGRESRGARLDAAISESNSGLVTASAHSNHR